MWEGLKQLYGTPFLSLHGDEPSWMWIRAMAKITHEDVITKLDLLAEQRRTFPPNLSEFLAVGKDPGVRYLGVPLTDEQKRQLYLPRPEVPRETIEKHLASMRKALGVGP